MTTRRWRFRRCSGLPPLPLGAPQLGKDVLIRGSSSDGVLTISIRCSGRRADRPLMDMVLVEARSGEQARAIEAG